MKILSCFLSKRYFHFSRILKKEMFSQRFSPTTGKMEWLIEDDDYDMRNEIARSAYTDMLHDDERNKKYYKATKQAVTRLQESGKKVHMLDIGTGTGLLAMMAVQSGADRATACEAFKPIANVASEIVKKNGFSNKILVVGKCSTALELEKDTGSPARANLLVTELWDTELIGEGALPTLRDACNRLLEPGFVSVPAAASVYVQVFGSESLWNMHQLNPKHISENQDVILPAEMEQCRGTASPFDLHVDELSDDEIHILSAPVPVLRFDFCSNLASTKSNCSNRVSLPDTKDKSSDSDKTVSHYCVDASVEHSGFAHGVIMWWTLDMDVDGEITLTTAPRWAHPDGRKRQWRDHWMQAVYFLKRPLLIQAGEKINIHCSHDDYSIWFDVTPQNRILTTVDRPLCTCGAHVTWSRHRFAMLNDRQRTEAFEQALKQLVTEGKSRCLSIGDGSLLPLLAAKAGFDKVITLESSGIYQKFLRKLIDLNGIGEKIAILDREAAHLQAEDLSTDQVDVIVGEPFFTSALFPWHNLYFWYAASSAVRIASPEVKILPRGASMKALAVEFEDLWKFHAPVNTVEGFDVSLFDKLIEGSKLTNEGINNEKSHGIALEPHHVWEYPCRALTQEFTVMTFDFTTNVPSDKLTAEGDITIQSSGTLHGIVIWMDFHLTEDETITTGLQQKQRLTDKSPSKLQWVRHTKQGVYFMQSPPLIEDGAFKNGKNSRVRYSVAFEPATGEIEFDFHLCSS